MEKLKKEADKLYPELETYNPTYHFSSEDGVRFPYGESSRKIFRQIWIDGASSKASEKYWIRKRTSRTNIFLRIAGFLPFSVLAILFSFSLFVRYLINFIQFGGEAITYTHKNQRHTIEDLYQELKKNNEK